MEENDETPNMGFLVCDTCGCVVDSASLRIHSDWHDELATPPDPVWHAANPERTQL